MKVTIGVVLDVAGHLEGANCESWQFDDIDIMAFWHFMVDGSMVLFLFIFYCI